MTSNAQERNTPQRKGFAVGFEPLLHYCHNCKTGGRRPNEVLLRENSSIVWRNVSELPLNGISAGNLTVMESTL